MRLVTKIMVPTIGGLYSAFCGSSRVITRHFSVVCFRISFVSIPASVFVFFSRLGVDMFFFIHFVMFNLAYFCGSVLGAA